MDKLLDEIYGTVLKSGWPLPMGSFTDGWPKEQIRLLIEKYLKNQHQTRRIAEACLSEVPTPAMPTFGPMLDHVNRLAGLPLDSPAKPKTCGKCAWHMPDQPAYVPAEMGFCRLRRCTVYSDTPACPAGVAKEDES